VKLSIGMSSRLRSWLTSAACMAILITAAPCVFGDIVTHATDPLERNFIAPPGASKLTAWWFWGESVTTDHGNMVQIESGAMLTGCGTINGKRHSSNL